MIYTWTCQSCDHVTDVNRSVKDIEVPPECCEGCKGHALKRTIPKRPDNIKGFILLGDSGWHHTDYTQYRSVK